MASTIHYRKNAALTLAEFIGVYRASTLAERRPADDESIMQQMMDNAPLTISAWDGDTPVGIARTLTDFGYVAYLADLAVVGTHQGLGIGRGLVAATRAELGADCMLVLLAAPDANAFYPKIGFSSNPRAWVLQGTERLR